MNKCGLSQNVMSGDSQSLQHWFRSILYICYIGSHIVKLRSVLQSHDGMVLMMFNISHWDRINHVAYHLSTNMVVSLDWSCWEMTSRTMTMSMGVMIVYILTMIVSLSNAFFTIQILSSQSIKYIFWISI